MDLVTALKETMEPGVGVQGAAAGPETGWSLSLPSQTPGSSGTSCLGLRELSLFLGNRKGAHPVILSASAQELGDHVGCWALNPGLLRSRQALYLL